MELLRGRSAEIGYSDPSVPRFQKMQEHQFNHAGMPLAVETLARKNCVVLITNHDAFDFDFIATHARLIVGSRGRDQSPLPHDNFVQA